MRTLALLLMLAGCTDSEDEKDDTASGSGTDDTGSGGAIDDLPTLTEDLETGGCDDWDGNEIVGAASYFFGEYEITGTDDDDNNVWEGTEYWLIYANPTWEDAGGADCQVVWTSSGTETSPSGCGSCEIGLDVTLTLDNIATTCSDELAEGWDGDVSYVIDVSDDGEATWYYSSSGNDVGAGYYEEGAANFLSEKQCDWF